MRRLALALLAAMCQEPSADVWTKVWTTCGQPVDK